MQREKTPSTVPDSPGRRPWLVIVLMVLLVDWLMYRAQGFAGPAVCFPCSVVLVLAGHRRVRYSRQLCLLTLMLLLLAFSMIRAGSFAQLVAALWLSGAIVMAAQNVPPYLLESLVFFAGVVPGGYEYFRAVQIKWRQAVLDPLDRGQPQQGTRPAVLNVLLPVISVLAFGVLFLLANPDLVRAVSTVFADVFTGLQKLFARVSPVEFLVWCFTIWLTGGLLRPLNRPHAESEESQVAAAAADFRHPLFSAFRNTLASLIVLFVVYLSFEFRTLWFRTFPQGFHYSGYAHEGAAWLTAALALATLVLSLILRGSMLNDPRFKALRQYAWAWSALNLLLAAAVYNRLLIYVGFNGMTRMRVVGFLGITAVVGGFVLVLRKISQRQNFIWLIRRQLWVLAFAVYVLLVMPVDRLVHRYNVGRILTGSPAPSVQISEHPIADEALPQLLPLLESDDVPIREGVRALLWTRLQNLQQTFEKPDRHWTETQLGAESALRQLAEVKDRLSPAGSAESVEAARKSLHDYSMQWW